jgi:transposase
MRRYNKLRSINRARGTRLHVDARPVVTHLKHLIADGMSWRQIRAAANISPSTVRRLLAEPETVRRDAAARILAVPRAIHDSYQPTDATGSIRRLRALYALGHSRETIAQAVGVLPTSISRLLDGDVEHVRGTTASQIRAAYTELSMIVGTCERTRNRAAREGWAPPLAWDDDVDDPNAVPNLGEQRPLSAAERLENYDWLIDSGVSPEVAAQRVGVSLRVIDRYRWRLKRRQRAAETTDGEVAA